MEHGRERRKQKLFRVGNKAATAGEGEVPRGVKFFAFFFFYGCTCTITCTLCPHPARGGVGFAFLFGPVSPTCPPAAGNQARVPIGALKLWVSFP